jgi:hypothetical protein
MSSQQSSEFFNLKGNPKMKCNLYGVVGLVALMFASTACSKTSSNDVDPSTVYGEIDIIRSGSSVQVNNTFSVAGATGTVLTIDSPASIQVNGIAANGVNDDLLNSTAYDATFNANVLSITVDYTDKNGLSYVNVFGVPGDFSSTSGPTTISISSSPTFTANTDNAFLSEEELAITFSSANGTSAYYEVNANAGASTQSITVPNTELSQLSTGAGTVQICRNSNPSASHPYPQGTTVTSTSCANTSNVTFTP